MGEVSLTVSNLNAPEFLEGYLHKKGELNTAFKKRYFVIKDAKASYFDTQKDYERKGVGGSIGSIFLEDCLITISEESKHSRKFCFELSWPNGKRTFVLSAETASSMQEWINFMRREVFKLRREKAKLSTGNESSTTNAIVNDVPANANASVTNETIDSTQGSNSTDSNLYVASYPSRAIAKSLVIADNAEHKSVLAAWKARNEQAIVGENYTKMDDFPEAHSKRKICPCCSIL